MTKSPLTSSAPFWKVPLGGTAFGVQIQRRVVDRASEEDKKQTLSPNKQKVSCETEIVGTGEGPGGASIPPPEVIGTGQEI